MLDVTTNAIWVADTYGQQEIVNIIRDLVKDQGFYIVPPENAHVYIQNKLAAETLIKALEKAIELGWVK